MKSLLNNVIILTSIMAGFILTFVWFGWKMAIVLLLLTQFAGGIE